MTSTLPGRSDSRVVGASVAFRRRPFTGERYAPSRRPGRVTNRVTASDAASSGTRTRTPERSTTTAIDSATTRTGTNAGGGDGDDLIDSAARIRRQRSKFDRVSWRTRQKALTVWPDLFQASRVAR